MSKRLDTKKVWKALQADPVFATQVPESAQAAIRELIEELPESLAPYLDKKVAMPSLMEAKLAVTERMLETDFPAKMAAAMPEALRAQIPVGELTEAMVESLQILRMPFMEMIHNSANFLAEIGVTERQLMADPKGVGFDARSLAAYDAGKLTIRSLLETQPAVVLLNNGGTD